MTPFEVQEIRVQGLRRISAGTVFNYLPVQVGDRLGQEQIQNAIRALYDTGFFQDVTLKREGGELIVEVVERPAIARIEIHGNEEIGDDDLLEGLSTVGLSEGRVFNRSLLANIERELQQQYFALGYYDVQIQSTVSPLPRNRVSVRLDVREGEPASIVEVQFVGNKSFDDEALREEFELGPTSWWQFFSDADKYSRDRLAGDLERLRSFYQDRGYVNFTITSTQVSISPDRRRIHIIVNLSEGKQYRVGKIDLVGELIYPESELRKLVEAEPGMLYSRQAVTDTIDAIREKLGERGYAFANVNVVPEVHESDKRVDLKFFVDPSERVYVRRINISGNENTRDEVIRRELLQMEGGWLSTEKVRESKLELQRLGFFQTVNIETPRVPGSPDQVDLNVEVEERLSGSLQAGIGYGTQQGVLLNFSIQQDNFLGTGDRVAFTANNSDIETVYRFSYLERFYTLDGIDRQYSLAYRSIDAEEADLSDYGVKSLTASYGYNIPLDQEDYLSIDLEFQQLDLDLGSRSTRVQRDFVDRHGTSTSVIRPVISWIRDTRNRAIFPTAGSRQQLSAEVTLPGMDLQYYRLSYNHRLYLGLTDSLTLALEGTVSYGDSYGDTKRLPFFENYYAGGISTVRGFQGNSLGPRDENDDPTGGNFRTLGSVQLLFPPPGAEESNIRFTTFVDAGQVWNTYEQQIDWGEVRYSAGIGMVWFSPLGPLTMSVARPLNDEPGDETQFFQFSLGTFF